MGDDLDDIYVSSATVSSIVVSGRYIFDDGRKFTLVLESAAFSRQQFEFTEPDDGSMLTFSATITPPSTATDNAFSPGASVSIHYLIKDYRGRERDEGSIYSTISKDDPSGITASCSGYTYGSSGNKVYSGTVNGKKGSVPMTGKVYIYRGNSQIAAVDCDADGKFSTSWSSTSLDPGDYTFSCYYAGNKYYNGYGSESIRQGSKTITVSKITPSGITASCSGYTYGASGSRTYSGTVGGKSGSISLAGKVYIYRGTTLIATVNCDADGKFSTSWSSTSLNPGDYTFSCYYGGNTYYKNVGSSSSRQASKSITVSKATVQGITVNSADYNYGVSGNQKIYYGQFTKYGSAGLSGTASVYRNGNLIKSDLSVDADGKFEYSISSTSLDVGTYTYTIVYNSNTYYNKYPSSGTTGSKTITVSKGTPQITVSSPTVTQNTYPGTVKVEFTVKNLKGDALSGITLTPGGNKFSSGPQGTDSNGKATFTVTPLDAGTYSDWTVTSTENKNYVSVTSSAVSSFTINKQVPTVNYVMFNTSDIYPGDNTVSITLTDNQGNWLENFTVVLTGTGFSLNNKTDAVGTVSFTLNNLGAGTYGDWKFTVGATSNFDTTTVNIPSFTIKPLNVSVSISDITPLVSIYKSVVTLNGVVIYPSNLPTPKGKVYAQLGDIVSSGSVNSNGTFTIEFEGVKPDYYYNVSNVYFEPDSTEKNYCSAELETFDIGRLIVYQSDSFIEDIKILDQSLNVITNLTYGTRITISGKVTGNGKYPTGNVSLYVDGNLNKAYARDEVGSSGEFYLVVKNAPAGLNHYFTVVYEGDDYYYESNNNSYLFNVTPDEINFENDKIQVTDGVYNGTGNSAYFIVVVSANGEGDIPRGQIRVNLSDNSRSWSAKLDGNTSTIYISNLAVGTYSGVTVEYVPAGDEFNYNPKVNSNTYSFEITKGVPEFTVDAPGVGLGEDAYIYINLPKDAKGIVTLQVRQDTYTFNLTDNPTNRTLKLSEPGAGAYKITASYSGDDNWKGHDDGLEDLNTTLYVERPGAVVHINVTDISYGEDAVINFTIYSKRGFEDKARGIITVYGLGKENGFDVEVTNGKGTLTVSDLPMGTYDVVAYYGGYNDLMGNINVSSFKVNGKDTKMVLTLNSSTMNVDDNVLLTVTVESDIEDPIYIYIDGERSGVVIAENGVAEFIISGLTTGSHIISAALPANEKYNEANNNTTIVVNKIKPDYTVDVVADSNKNIIFNIYVGENATGRVTIVGNGTNKKTLVDEGFAEYTLTGLAPGVYTYNVTYSGDENYEGFTVLRTVNSDKISDYPMIITNTETASGKPFSVFVSVPSQLNGKTVHLYVNGDVTPLDSTVSEGIATFTVGAAVTSAYSSIVLTAVYDGDENYETKTVNKTVVIDKISEYDLIINIPDVVYVGDDVTVTVTCPDDIYEVNITVNGVNKGEFAPTTGMTLSDIDEGSYNLLVSYGGDNIYYAKQSNVTFSAIKRTPSLNVSVGDVVYGNDVVISINITDGTTGVVLVTMDGAEYRYLDVAGSHNIVIRDSAISVGDHNLSVRYVGDRIYNPAESDTYNFTISKNNTFAFEVIVNEMNVANQSTVNINDVFSYMFEIALPADATRKVDLTIKKAGSTVATKVFNLPNNMVNVDLGDYGEYNVSLVYSGDDNYDSKEIVFNLIIESSKVKTEFGFDETKSLPIYSNLTDNVLYINSTNYNGKVELFIDGVFYNNILITNNVGQITLPALTAGNHLFALNYDGDSNHNPYHVEEIFNVVKQSTNLTIDVEAGHVSELTNITISIIDAEGNVIGDAGGYVFVNISGETQLLEVKKGVVVLNVTYLVNGTRNINAVYRGDSRYDISNKSDEFAVDKFTTNVAVDVRVVELNDVLTIRVNYTDASGEMQVTIGEISKTLNVFDGEAVLGELPENNGTYVLHIEYDGDWKYTSSEAYIEVVINKVSDIPITVPGNVTIDEELVITVGDETTAGKLNVTIANGEMFTVDVVNGKAVILVEYLPQASDKYNISLNYYDGSYWENAEYNTSFHADKITDYTFTIAGPVIKFGENATLEIRLPIDVNTVLTLTINDADKTVEIIKGYGKLENISGLHANANTVTSTFGSDKYETVTKTTSIMVEPNDITLTVILPVEQLYVDQSATIKVLANVSMNNNVTVYINGEKNRTLTLDNGEASFTIPKLVYGKYLFTAVFDGNENYTQKTSDSQSFNVDKNNITLNVTADNIIVGHDAEVKVGIDGDATGLVIVQVDDHEYTLNVTNKEYNLIVSDLGNGTHDIIVKYYGDSKYYGGENTTSFEVIKLAPSIDISSHILIGDDLIISISNSSSIVASPTGKLTFTIGDDSVVVGVVNGVAIIDANDLPQVNDTYTATVEYSGDKNYDSLTESVSFTIEKVPRLIITVPSNVTIDDKMTISVGDEEADGKLNVTIGNGEMFTVDVVNGKAVIPVKYLPQASNTYAISIDYYAGSYWNDTRVVRFFHADKITDYPFIISNDTIKFDGVSTIRFTLPGDVNTTLTVLIDDIVKTVKITDGNGVLSIGNLHSGVNMVSTTFGNEKYETTSASSFIRVLANDITLNITVPEEQLYVDGEAVITVQANVTMNNTVTVYVNGEPMSLKLNNGKANFTIAPLVYGKYVFTAIFEGNENYTRANADMKTFNVEKIIPTFNVNVEDLLVDEDALIEVTGLPEDATGIVLIDINGTVYSLKINKGKGNLTVAGLKYGKYDVVANFTGDNKYYSNISTTSFNVDKNVIGEIKVSSGRIKDNKTQVTVTVPALDATGYVIIEVNNLTFAAKLLDGKTQIEVTNLTMGENLFNVTYVGDDKYLSNMTNGVIIIDGIFIESGVNVTVDDIMVDGKAKFSISVFDDATGYVLLEVDGNGIRLPIFDAKAEFSLGNFKAGSYNVTVTYLGDDKYYTSTNSTTFNVFRYVNGITVEVENGVAGTPITIEVIGDNADATGDVTITVDGVNYTAAMKDGATRFNITVEKAGEFEVVARYSGNDYYEESIANNSFTLDSATVSLNITAEDIVIGEDAVIIVKLADDAIGNVTLSLRTTRNSYSSPIVDGVARFTIHDLKAGTYYITADYAGDIKYAQVTDDTASFVVSKKNTTNMISFNVNTDDNGTNVTVNVPENATGNITITMGDNKISAPVVDGVAVINLGNLTGDKNVTISYTGDDVYAGFSESAVISTKSAKLNSRITIEVTDINVGENANIIVHVPEDATGNVILSIDGKNYTSVIANAKAAFNIGGLGNGTHAIIAYFQGDEKYLKSENDSAITVNKLTPSIVVSADDITVGEATNIVVEVPSDATGTVEITIGDERYTASVSSGKAVFAIKGLANGTYTVSALYLGDAKYLTNSTSASFNVAKNNIDPVGDNKSSIKVETKDNKTIVTVDLPEDATGYVNITIDNETYTNVPVVNGTVSIPVNNVSENANISFAYSGDDKYDGFNQNATATDEGVKLNAQIIVKSDKSSYAAGEQANIIVATPADATGKLTVKVNGEVIAEVEGTDIIEYVVPAGGEFNIEVSYSGDKKYAPVSNSIAFTAEKTNSTTAISVDDTTFDENATVTVIVPADAKGNVTLTVGDNEYTANVTDGKAVFILPKLGIGKYTIYAVYNGDDKYESSSADAEFNSELKVVAENIIWGENATVSVISPNGTQGMLTVVCEKATFVVEITDSVMNFTFTDLLPGKHELSVVYDRTADGYQVTIKKEIDVARLASNMTVSVDDVIVGNDVVIHVTVNSTGDVNGSLVTVTINGKEYNATVVNGTADIRISGLGVGKYENINVTFMGTQFVAPSVENVTFNVNVLPVNLIGGKNINVFYLQGAQYSIRVMDISGKPLSGIRVTFNVGGKIYNVVSDANGYAKLNVNLKPGSYKITASANGKSVSNNIKVKSIITAKKTTNVKKKAKKTIIKITVKGHKVKQSSKVKFTYKGKNKISVKFGKDMKKQTVLVKFKGKTYKVKVNGKGKGTLKLAKKVAKKLRKGKKYSLKVTFNGPKLYKKVKVTVKFNGKKYKVKTNNAGEAKFKVTKKMVKKFKKGKKVKYTITYKLDTINRFVKIK